ncbi:ATP-binding protein [Motilibacter deserti]|uniref:ATP-binding protein n=1 Tax=Motilibacter deserti TaxID=2714956 RepID=A0ABX0GZ58_9ACTN|nr:ATP-binding protein [Motilibacter deserti]
MSYQHVVAVPLTGEPASVREARRLLSRTLEEWGAEESSDAVLLAASELITNAMRHGRPPMRVAVALGDDHVRVGVSDSLPQCIGNAADPADDDAESGRGLGIVAALSSDWGCSVDRGAKEVWFTVDVPHRQLEQTGT